MITAICDLYAKRYYITINYILHTVHFIRVIHLFHKNSVSLNLPYLFLFSPKPPPLQQSSICSQRLGRWLKTQFNSILKSRDITLPTKVCLVKVMVFPVVMYGCASWTVKKAEHRRIDAFELWCWRRLLRVPWTARRSNQSILKEISPGCSSEGMMLKLKLQYFGHLIRRVDSLEKTLMLGGIGGRRKRGWQRMRWLDGVMDSMDMNLSELRELVMDRDCDSWGRKELDTTEWLNWTECPLGPSMLLEIARFHSFYGWVIFHCIFIPLLLYPFIYQRALRILLYLSYYK